MPELLSVKANNLQVIALPEQLQVSATPPTYLYVMMCVCHIII
jgi:hypothetical protein